MTTMTDSTDPVRLTTTTDSLTDECPEVRQFQSVSRRPVLSRRKRTLDSLDSLMT